MPIAAAITRQDAAKLRQLEDVLATAKRWAIEEAKALYTIQRDHLYRGDFETFEQYVADRWGYDRTHAYRLSQWGQTLCNLSPIGDDLPERESHARPLYPLKPAEQRKVWTAVCRRSAARRTAEDIEQVVRQVVRLRTPQIAFPGRTSGTVIHADAIAGLGTLAEQSVDLVLFSPPYCEQRQHHYPSIAEADYPDWMTSIMEAIRPKLKPTGNVLVVAREHVRKGQISDVWLKTRLAIRAAGWREADTLIWHKPDAPPIGDRRRPRRTWEYVYWFSLSPTPFLDNKACGHEASKPGRMRDKKDTLHSRPQCDEWPVGTVARVTDLFVSHVGTVVAHVNHPAMMPPSLAEQLVKTFSPVGGFVADPCCGSGTSLLAAQEHGREWWGCDVVKRYASLARRRLTATG
jgi:DNA modification methylase